MTGTDLISATVKFALPATRHFEAGIAPRVVGESSPRISVKP